MTLGNSVGWAMAFLLLIALTDIPPTAQVAAAFGWLILIAVLAKYGGQAAANVTSIVSPATAQTANSKPNDASVPSIIQQGQKNLA